jgi:hypothetical protein
VKKSDEGRRFFFNVIDGEKCTQDRKGTVLPDVETAMQVALYDSQDLLKKLSCDRTARRLRQFQICAEDGEVLAMVPVNPN